MKKSKTIAETSSSDIAEAKKIQGKLREAFPSSPKLPPICEVKVDHEEKDIHHVHVFAAWYSAKKFIDGLTDGRKVKEINDNVIKTDDGIKIKSILLQDILGHKYNALEEKWEIPDPYRNMIRMFRGEAYKKSENGENASQVKSKSFQKEMDDVGPKKKSKERTPRAPKEGMVSIADICATLKCEPRIARGILRDAKFEKPDGGWSWPKGDKQIDVITKAITKGLK